MCRSQRQTGLFFFPSACLHNRLLFYSVPLIQSLHGDPPLVVASKTLSIIPAVRLCVGQFQQPPTKFHELFAPYVQHRLIFRPPIVEFNRPMWIVLEK